MRTRIISGVVLGLIILGAVLGGGITMFILSLVVTGLGMYELYKVVGIQKSALGITGYLLATVYYTLLWFDMLEYLHYFCVGSGILIMFAYVCSFNTKKASQAAFALLGIYYVAIPLSYMYRIRILDYGFHLIVLLIVCSWIADSFAYFIGSAFGKHKLVPHLSPKKSVEGAVSGVVGATLVGMVYGIVLSNVLHIHAQIPFTIASAAGSFFSIFGDLAASAIKRNYDIKDYSKLIPGHGGILDRFDSLIFVAPAIYIVGGLLMREV